MELNVWQLAAVNLVLLFLLKALALVLGYLCVRLGQQLISSGAKGEFKFSAEGLGAKTNLVSISPGLLFVLLGICLMIYSVAVDKIVKVGPQAAAEAPEVPFPGSM